MRRNPKLTLFALSRALLAFALLALALACALPLSGCGAVKKGLERVLDGSLGDPKLPSAEENAPGLSGFSEAALTKPAALPIAQGYTDPAAIVVDETVLARADGQILDWDAPFEGEFGAQNSGETTSENAKAFDEATWPQNEYTQGLPLPLTGKVSLCGEDEERPNAYSIVFEGMPYESFLEYVELLKRAGFTENAQSEDYSAYGPMEGLSYAATGPDGRTVEALSIAGTTMLTILK